MVLTSDHVTPATGKTLTVTISKNGSSFGAALGSVVELGDGWYTFAGNATDRNTLGTLAINASATDCDDSNLTIEIVSYDPFVRIDSNVTYWKSAVVATPDTPGYPKVTIKDGTGQGELDITNGTVSITGGGIGARTVIITVNDGSTVISGAIVRLTLGVDTYIATTNESGVATFNIDDGSWTVSITKSGYTYAGTTLVVNGDESVTYSMAAINITPASDPLQTTAYLVTRDGHGTISPNTSLSIQLVEGPGEPGNSYDKRPFTVTSDDNALLQVTLLRESKYVGTRDDGNRFYFTTPDASTYQLPEWR